ncbi:MAG: glycosyltransferase [Clostridia bacterium]|nr:glycosyltransferase [Clostridia bacterium]
MKLSIIVPIYKVESYLRRCIDSILAQTFTDFELILVDDGSPDNCPVICDEYSKKDSRVVVIHKENGGISDARNAGLDIAQGEYIGFVDSDDFIHRQTYEIALKTAQKNQADIVQWGWVQYSDVNEINSDIEFPNDATIRETIESSNIAEIYYPQICYKINASVWNKLYVRKVFDNIRFPIGLIYEDFHITLSTLNAAKKLVIIAEEFYYYYQRMGSIMHEEYSPKCFTACLVLSKHVDYFLKRKNASQRNYAAHDYLDRYSQHILRVCFEYKQYKKDFTPFRRQYLRKLRYIIFNPTVCRMKKLMAMMLVISPKIAYKICRKYFPECLFESMR